MGTKVAFDGAIRPPLAAISVSLAKLLSLSKACFHHGTKAWCAAECGGMRCSLAVQEAEVENCLNPGGQN